jgi:PAS domain S-box-containing protein
MTLKSIKIPLAFLIAGILWAVFSDPLITFFTQGFSSDIQDYIRSFNDFVFVSIVAVLLYFAIKKQQQKLVRSEDEYRRLFDSTPNPMWIYNLNTLKFVKVNHAAVELYGYSKGEFLSMTIKDIRPASDHKKLDDFINSAGDGIRRAGNWRHLKRSGELLYVSIVSYRITFNNEPCSLVMATNVTESVITEERIKTQNKTLQEIAWSNSHEVRHSLCSIISLTALLKDARNDSERIEYMNLLQKCTNELDIILKKTGKKVDELQSAV